MSSEECRIFTRDTQTFHEKAGTLMPYESTAPEKEVLLCKGFADRDADFCTTETPLALEDLLDFVRNIAARDKAAFLGVEDDNKVDMHLCDYNTLIDVARQYIKVIGE